MQKSMHCRAIGIILAGAGAMSLSAQTAPQFTRLPKASAIDSKIEATLRQFMKDKALQGTGVCSIPLISVPIPKNLEQMPILHPPAENIDNMPSVKLPAPPCDEEKR